MNVHVAADDAAGATTAAASAARHHAPVVIIGAGFGGIAMAITLKQEGMHDFIMLERGADVGGVWRDNSYPGAACDVVSRFYSYSFEQRHDWSAPFAPQGEILDYIKECAEKYDIRRHIRFDTEVVSATFDEAGAQWLLETRSGDTFTTPVLISAAGLFNQPNIPDIPGRDTFQGTMFHSARWNHDVDLTGKTVAVIGNGASGVQFIPRVAEKVKRLHLFQRSPQYVLPKSAFPGTGKWDLRLQKYPALRGLARAKIFLMFERFLFNRVWFPDRRKLGEAAYARLLHEKIKDPVLREKLTPKYPLGCKRLLVSDVWLDALAKPHVDVIDTPIARITADGVETKDGTHRKVDAIIFGTGFRVHDYLAPMRVTGLNGRDLNQEWRKGAEAYLGAAVHGFPNFFMLYGPNTNAATSIIFMLECEARYIMRCIRKLGIERARMMNVREDAQRTFNEALQARLARTVPALAACNTYFKNEFGRQDTNWPGYASEYRIRTRRVRTRDFEFS